jgi:uncharacterized membrane protein
MSQWHCQVGGQQYGPVQLEILKAWAAQGRVKATDYVWEEGTPAWVQASSVPGLCVPPSPASPAGLGSMVLVAPPGGTGGQMFNDDITASARAALRGRWGLPIGFCLIYALLQMAAALLPYIGLLALLIFDGPLVLGAVVFFLTFTRGGQAELGMLFAGFNRFGTAMAALLLRSLFVQLWFLLGALPGSLLALIVLVVMRVSGSNENEAAKTLMMAGLVVGVVLGAILAVLAQLGYSQTMYFLADDRSLGPLAAIRQSKQMMQGHRGRLFLLKLRFLLWGLLCLLTCGIGYIWLAPYVATSFARFYDDLRPPAGVPMAATVPQPIVPPPA